ncbi:MAG: hypothetical protein U9R25_02210 [Chloroflexota bacterium]|nr:hypothetical protein [Chloroflexota bacterium]
MNFNHALRVGIRTGIAFAVVAIFIILTGMVESFADRELLLVGTLGTVILIILGILPGLMAGRTVFQQAQSEEKGTSTTSVLLAGSIAGFFVGLSEAILVFLLANANLRTVLVNATQDLYEVLTFGLPTTQAMLLWLVAGTLLGLMGAALQIAPGRARLIILALFSLWILASLLETEFLVFLAVIALLGLFTRWYTGRHLPSGTPFKQAQWRHKVFFGVVLVVWLLVMTVGPAILGDYWARVLLFVGIYTMLGLGLNIVVGFAGLLDLGYVAFFAIGAYTMALLTSAESSLGLEMSFWVALPICMVTAAITGILLGFPVLRMRGDYLAIVTLGFGEIIRILLLSDMAKSITGGPQGVLGTAPPELAGFVFNKPLHYYYLVVLGCLLVAFVSARLVYARIGRAWVAMREDEDVAEAMGVNLVRYKLLAFATGAAFAGISGGIFASFQKAIFPADFTLFVSINVLVLIIIGGIGSIPGVILGAAVLVGLPEVLREVDDYRILAYGALLVIMMIVRPEGLWPAPRRKMELHESDETGPDIAPVSSST